MIAFAEEADILMKNKKEYNKKYYQEHKEHNKKYYQIHREEILKRVKKYNKENKEKIKEYQIDYYQLRKQERKKYYQDNRKRILKQVKKYWQFHKKEKTYYKPNKLKTNINFKIMCNLRNRIWYALKRNIKSKSTILLIGCSLEKLKQHLESKFKQGMSFPNYGKWHIDHIKPCASFDLCKISEQKKCFHYTNLQPLWAKDNFSKGDR